MKKLSAQFHFDDLRGSAKNQIFDRFYTKVIYGEKLLMSIESLKHFSKKPLYKALWPKIWVFKLKFRPPIRQKSEIAPKIFSRLLTYSINSQSFNKIWMLHLGYNMLVLKSDILCLICIHTIFHTGLKNLFS